MIDAAPCGTAAGPDRPGRRINMNVGHARKIEHEAVIADAQAAGIVASTTDRYPYPVIAAKTYGLLDVGNVGTLRDQSRLAVDHAVVNLARIRVAGIIRGDQGPSQLRAKLSDGFV